MDAESATARSLARFRERMGIRPECYDAEAIPPLFIDHPGQVRAWNSEKRIVAVIKGWQAGGTLIGSPWLLREIQRKGAGDYMVITPSSPLLENKALPEFKKVFERGSTSFGTYYPSRTMFEFSAQGMVNLFGEDLGDTRVIMAHAQRPESVEAATIKGLWADEPGQFDDAIWEAINARCSVNQARMLLTSRPYKFNFFKYEIWDKDGIDPDIDVIQFSSIMNPAFSILEWERQKRLLGGADNWRFKMKYGGEFTKPGGSIYEGWDDQWGIVEPFVIPASWKRTWGVDFGGANTAVVKCATDPNSGMVYVYEEYEGGNKPSWMHVQEVMRNEPLGVTPLAAGGAYSEDKVRNEWQVGGLCVQKPSVKDLEVGIERTQSMIFTKSFRVFKTCPKLVSYLNNYAWETDDEGDPVPDKIESKSSWHVGDAFRYRNVQWCTINEGEVSSYSRIEAHNEDNDQEFFSLW